MEVDRRKFMETVGAAAVVLGAEACAPSLRIASDSLKNIEDEKEKIEMERLLSMSKYERTHQEQERVHAFFKKHPELIMDKIKEKEEMLITFFSQSDDPQIRERFVPITGNPDYTYRSYDIKGILLELDDVSCTGFLLKWAATKKTEYPKIERKIKIFLIDGDYFNLGKKGQLYRQWNADGCYYGARIDDYCPVADDLDADSLNRRIATKKRKYLLAKKTLDYYTRLGEDPVMSTFFHENIEKTKDTEEDAVMVQEIGLDDLRKYKMRDAKNIKIREKQLNEILDIPLVRRTLAALSCTLAEAYSIANATADHAHQNKLKPEQAFKNVIKEWIDFVTRKLIDKETSVIIFVDEKDNTTKTSTNLTGIAELSRALGVEDDKIQLLTFKDENETINQRKKGALAKAISESQGKTFVYISSHGNENGDEFHSANISKIKPDNAHEDITETTYMEIALALLERVVKTKDKDSLKELTIMTGQCYGGWFMEDIYDVMEVAFMVDKRFQNLGFEFKDLAMPCTISASQPGRTNTINYQGENMQRYLPSIKKEEALTGMFVMRRMLPSRYHLSSYAINIGQQAGHYFKIADSKNGQTDSGNKQPHQYA